LTTPSRDGTAVDPYDFIITIADTSPSNVVM
jgi:hypothetical protein